MLIGIKEYTNTDVERRHGSAEDRRKNIRVNQEGTERTNQELKKRIHKHG